MHPRMHPQRLLGWCVLLICAIWVRPSNGAYNINVDIEIQTCEWECDQPDCYENAFGCQSCAYVTGQVNLTSEEACDSCDDYTFDGNKCIPCESGNTTERCAACRMVLNEQETGCVHCQKGYFFDVMSSNCLLCNSTGTPPVIPFEVAECAEAGIMRRDTMITLCDYQENSCASDHYCDNITCTGEGELVCANATCSQCTNATFLSAAECVQCVGWYYSTQDNRRICQECPVDVAILDEPGTCGQCNGTWINNVTGCVPPGWSPPTTTSPTALPTASPTTTASPTASPTTTASPTQSPTTTASPTALPTASPTTTASPTASPTTTASPTALPTASPTTTASPTASPTNPPTTTASPIEMPTTTASPIEMPTTTASPTEPPTTTASPTEPPTTTASPTEPPTTTASPTEPPTTTASPTNPPTTTASPTNPPTEPICCSNIEGLVHDMMQCELCGIGLINDDKCILPMCEERLPVPPMDDGPHSPPLDSLPQDEAAENQGRGVLIFYGLLATLSAGFALAMVFKP